MSKFSKYVQESYDELLHKVTWPTWSELQQSTVIVLVALIIITFVLLGMNAGAENIMKLIYGV
jgi:preprotein translocase subunit SecE